MQEGEFLFQRRLFLQSIVVDLKKQRFDLIQAVLGNNFGLVKNTIKKRFSLVNARNDERTPILLLAMEKDYHRIVKYLME
jgi:hypothetical protein